MRVYTVEFKCNSDGNCGTRYKAVFREASMHTQKPGQLSCPLCGAKLRGQYNNSNDVLCRIEVIKEEN